MQIHRSPLASYSSARGFSLIELMIVVSIVAILAAISIPSYNNYVLKAQRKEAIAYVYSLTETLERARSTLLSYKSFDNFTSSQSTFYQYTVDVSDDGSSYTIKASAVGNQQNDRCGDLTYRSDNSWEFQDSSLNTQDCL